MLNATVATQMDTLLAVSIPFSSGPVLNLCIDYRLDYIYRLNPFFFRASAERLGKWLIQ